MKYLYYNPEDFGLNVVGEIDWSDAAYEFDLTVVWIRKSDGALVYAEDGGCSCPVPFEDIHTAKDLVPTTPAELQAHLQQRDQGGKHAADIAELMSRVV
jgi:hypothetical protein